MIVKKSLDKITLVATVAKKAFTQRLIENVFITLISTHGLQESLLTKTVIENVFIAFVPTALQ